MEINLENILPANHEWRAVKCLIYGPQGLGKTTFGATFESPILARTEDGANAIDVPTFPGLICEGIEQEGPNQGNIIKGSGFYNMLGVINALHGDHQYKTLLIDSLDWLEPLIWSRTCARCGQETIEGFGYGKGYIEADSEWRYIMGGLESLRINKGMNIVLIAHSEVKNYAAPDTESYDRYQIKLHKRAFALWQEWVDMVLFCKYRTVIEKTEKGFNQEQRRGTGSGERIIHTEERPAFLAKNRWSLPPEIYVGTDKKWSTFHKAMNEATNGRYPIPNQ
jgi:hypothetical protein